MRAGHPNGRRRGYPASIPIGGRRAWALSLSAAGNRSAAGVGALALAAVPAIKGVTTAITGEDGRGEGRRERHDRLRRQADLKAAQRALSDGVSAQQALDSGSAATPLAPSRRPTARWRTPNEPCEPHSSAASAASVEHQRKRQLSTGERRARGAVPRRRSATVREGAGRSLTQARADAAQQLRDLNDQLERRASSASATPTLRVKEAQEELEPTLRGVRRRQGDDVTAPA
jgi:hypothetical protein